MEKITENFESVMLDSYLGLSYAVSNILHGSLLNQVGFLVLKENIQNFANCLMTPQNLLVSIWNFCEVKGSLYHLEREIQKITSMVENRLIN